MIRLILATLLVTLALDAQAAPDTCHVTGTAYDYAGLPLPSAVIRLVDRQTRQSVYRETDASAAFAFADLPADSSGQRYQLDVLSRATEVTGSHMGMTMSAPTIAAVIDRLSQKEGDWKPFDKSKYSSLFYPGGANDNDLPGNPGWKATPQSPSLFRDKKPKS